jgi:type I restriction-modification system DNA methylase subunit
VKFIVDVLPITHESLVLDGSCGSGGFLLHALDKVRRQADEYFPPGAEHFRHWHGFAQNNLYGVEINEQIARTAKMNMIIHDDGHTNVVAADGLLPPEELCAATKNRGFAEKRFNFVITNPPFGSTVKQTEKAYLHQYRLAGRSVDWLNPKSKAAERPGQDTEVLFIEQYGRYLAEGGYLAIVIPDGLLTNSSLQYVRDEIENLFRIVAVVSMPQTAFAATGAGVKSSVLFLKRHGDAEAERMRDAKQKIRDSIRAEERLEEKLTAIEQEKKAALRELDGREDLALSRDGRKENEAHAARQEIADRFAAQVDGLRGRLTELYEERRRKTLPDYPIFMAIAEDIGYDATGRPTKTNELDAIAEELARFVAAIEEGKA